MHTFLERKDYRDESIQVNSDLSITFHFLPFTHRGPNIKVKLVCNELKKSNVRNVNLNTRISSSLDDCRSRRQLVPWPELDTIQPNPTKHTMLVY